MSNLIRIAIADDHELVRSGLATILNTYEGLHVAVEAANGEDLLQQLESTAVDVVLLDLEMPVMDGKTALAELQKTHPDVKVVILTMHQHDTFIVEMMESGASGYLLKDTSPKEVATAIRTVMEEGLYFNSRVSRALLAGVSGKKQGTNPALPSNEPTQRDVDVLRLICEELTTAQIAEKLFLSPKTIEGYRKTLLAKTGTKNAAGLAIYAVRNGLV